MGPLVSVSSPTPCSRRPWTVWCWSALFYDGHPSLVAACGLSSLGSRLASSSFARSRSALQCPLHSRSCAFLYSTDRFTTPASILAWLDGGDSPNMATTHAPVDGQLGTGVSSCAFCTSPVGDLTHCLTCCPAFADLCIQWCAAAHVAPAEAPLWTQHSWKTIRRIWPTPAALCARISSLLARCVAASILADGDVLIYDASSGKRSSKLLFRVNAPSSFQSVFFLFVHVTRIRSRQGHLLSDRILHIVRNRCRGVAAREVPFQR